MHITKCTCLDIALERDRPIFPVYVNEMAGQHYNKYFPYATRERICSYATSHGVNTIEICATVTELSKKTRTIATTLNPSRNHFAHVDV